MEKLLTCLAAMIHEDTTINELEFKRYMRLLYRVAHLVKESRNEK